MLKTYLGNHIKGQLIPCGTSVAANYRAACIAHSKAAFTAKLSIVIEEADESEFWIQFIIDEELKPNHLVEPLLKEANELALIFIISRKTAQRKLLIMIESSIKNHKSTIEYVRNIYRRTTIRI